MIDLLYNYYVIDRTHRPLRVTCEDNLGEQYKTLGLSPEERMTRRLSFCRPWKRPVSIPWSRSC